MKKLLILGILLCSQAHAAYNVEQILNRVYDENTGALNTSGGGSGSGTVNTGTAGYISYYPASNTTIDNTPNIYTDGTNVGIGTTTTPLLLSVAGGGYFSGNVGIGTTTTTDNLVLGTTSGSRISLLSTTDAQATSGIQMVDVNLYRSGANILKLDDVFALGTSGNTILTLRNSVSTSGLISSTSTHGSTGNGIGLNFNLSASESAGGMNTIIAGATRSNSTGGSSLSLIGVKASATYTSTGTQPDAVALYGSVSKSTSASGSITNAYSVWGEAPAASGGGSITNAYGIGTNGVLGFSSAIGSAADTNLYRSAANTLKTDDAFVAMGNVAIGTTTTSGAALTINGLADGYMYTTTATQGGLVNTAPFPIGVSVGGTGAISAQAAADNILETSGKTEGYVYTIVSGQGAWAANTSSLFTDSTTTTYLTATGDDFVVGTTAPINSGKLSVLSTDDQATLVVKGASGQTANLIEAKTNADANRFVVGPAGDITAGDGSTAGIFKLTGASSVTTDAAAELAFDTDAQAASHGAFQYYDGTANLYVVGVSASDSPSDDQVLTWQTGGVPTWETPAAVSGTKGINLPIYSAKISGAYVVLTPSGGDAISQGAQIDAGDGNWRLLFDATTDEGALWQWKLPPNWTAHGTIKVDYSMASATSGTVEFEASLMCVSPGDSADIGTASFAAAAVASGTVPGTAGYMAELSITPTDDSCAAGDMMFVLLSTDANDGTNDTATGDREVVGIEYQYTG